MKRIRALAIISLAFGCSAESSLSDGSAASGGNGGSGGIGGSAGDAGSGLPDAAATDAASTDAPPMPTCDGGSVLIYSGPRPTSLAVSNSAVFFPATDGNLHAVGDCGQTPTTLTAIAGTATGVATDGSNVYFAHTRTSFTDGEIDSIPVNGGAITRLYWSNVGPSSLHLDGSSLYFAEFDLSTSIGAVRAMPTSGDNVSVSLAGAPLSVVDPVLLETDRVTWVSRSYPNTTIYTASLPGGTPVPLFTMATQSYTVNALARDDTYVYFTLPGINAGQSALYRVPLAGGSASTLASNLDFTRGLVVDPSGVIVWLLSSIVKIPLAGGTPTTLVAGEANDENFVRYGSYVYWTTGGIWRAPISPPSYPVQAQLVYGPASGATSLAVDSDGVFWTSDDGSVGRAALDGSNPVILGSYVAGPNYIPVQVTTDANNVYWLAYNGVILSLPKTGGEPTILAEGQISSALHSDGTSITWVSGATAGVSAAVNRMPITGWSVTKLAKTFGGQPLRTTTDARSVWFINGQNIDEAPKSGGGVQLELPLQGYAGGLAADASGVYVVEGPTTGPTSLLRIDPSTGSRQPLASLNSLTSAIATDQSHVYFPNAGIFSIDKNGGQPALLTPAGGVSMMVLRSDALFWVEFGLNNQGRIYRYSF